MPQWRKLHTKISESLDFHEMPDDFTRLLWAMMPLALDREGRAQDLPALLRSRLFPLREDVTAEMVREALDWFAGRIDEESGLGMIVRYEVAGRRYFFSPTFPEYQNTQKEAASTLPAPPESVGGRSGVSPELVESRSGVSPEQVGSGSSTDVDVDEEVDVEVEETQTQSDAGNGGGSGQKTAAALFTEANSLAVSPLDIDQIEALVRETDRFIGTLPREGPGANVTGEEWVRQAIEEANRSKRDNRVPVRFVEAIVSRWEKEGFRAPMKKGRPFDSTQGRQGRAPPAEYEAGDYAAGVCAKCGASPCMCEGDAGGNGQSEEERARAAWRDAEDLLKQQAILAPFKQCTVLGLSADGGSIRVAPEESQRAWFERRPAIARKARACGVEVVLDAGG